MGLITPPWGVPGLADSPIGLRAAPPRATPPRRPAARLLLAMLWAQATARIRAPSTALSVVHPSRPFGGPGRDVELPALVVHGDIAHLGRRAFALSRAEAEVIQDLTDGPLVVKVGHDGEWASAIAAGERVGVIDLGDQPGPARRCP